MLSGVASLGVGLGSSRLEHEQSKTRYYIVEVSLLHCCDLRVLMTKSYKVPERCHFNELRVKFLTNLF